MTCRGHSAFEDRLLSLVIPNAVLRHSSRHCTSIFPALLIIPSAPPAPVILRSIATKNLLAATPPCYALRCSPQRPASPMRPTPAAADEHMSFRGKQAPDTTSIPPLPIVHCSRFPGALRFALCRKADQPWRHPRPQIISADCEQSNNIFVYLYSLTKTNLTFHLRHGTELCA